MLDKRLMHEIGHNRIYFSRMILNGFLNFLFAVGTAYILSNLIHAAFIKKEPFTNQIWKIICFFILILLKAVVTYLMQSYFKKAAVELKNKILLQALNQLFQKGPILAKQESSGGIVSSWIEAADEIEPFYGEYLPQFFTLMITVPLLLFVSFGVDAVSACIMLVTGPLLPFLSLVGMQSKEANQKRLKRLLELGDSMLDFLNGIRTLKIFHGVESYRTIIEKNSDEFRKETMQVLKIAFLSAFVLEFAATISTALIAVSLGLRLLYRNMDFYPAFFILLITPDYYMAIRKFGAKFHTAMGAKAGADKLCTQEDGKDREKADFEKKPQIPLGNTAYIDIHLKNISYQYAQGKNQALKDITMTIENRKITALVGKSGSGKSTLSYLLMQYIKGEGEIDFNLHKLNKYDTPSIQKLIAYIPQRPYIFQDTLKNNLSIAKKDATREELMEVLKKSALTEFVKKLPQGMDTMLTEIGESISIGEAQRIAFARAYLKNAPIIVMDEITSALDEENEKLVKETFETLCKEKTVFVIAHRLETVKNAHKIYVMEEGSIKESGTHESLLLENGIYKELVETWGESN